jgi:hypothetical protein
MDYKRLGLSGFSAFIVGFIIAILVRVFTNTEIGGLLMLLIMASIGAGAYFVFKNNDDFQ